MNARPSIVFHHPIPVQDTPGVGSQVRVHKMLEAFADLGADVELVDGYTTERVPKMRRLVREVRDGRHFDAVYSEATTAPTCLNDPHHLPLHPFADAVFLRRLHSHGVPVGIYYRDVHWRYEQYRAVVPLHKRAVTTIGYHWDLLWYRAAVDALFLPSMAMAKEIPGWRDDPRVVALPPGGDDTALPWNPTDGVLKLLYVGGVVPPLYDVSDLVAAVAAADRAELVICCPADQRAHLTGADAASGITVVHARGDALVELYRACDVACLVYPDMPYRAFAMPLKLFEAIGFGRPVLVSPRSAVADFVRAHSVGWVSTSGDLAATIELLAADSSLVEECRRAVLAAARAHTWRTRAETALDVLSAQGRQG